MNSEIRIASSEVKKKRRWVLLLFAIRYSLFAASLASVAFAVSPARAQDSSGVQSGDQTDAPDEDSSELKPTEIGIRFTPQLAAAMSKRFVEQMKPRYDLDDRQADEITEIMQRQIMKFARDNAALGRDMIELMVPTMVENDGRFPRAEAQDFAKMASKFTPRFKDFVTQSSTEIGKKMNIKQRLKYTADVGMFAAGLMTFENRMKRWEDGKIGDNANPFFDPGDSDPAKTEPEPAIPGESDAHRSSRKNVERWFDRTVDRDKQWADYVERAAKHYDLTETQITAARAILKDCQQRAAAIRTPEWQTAVKEVCIFQELTARVGGEMSQDHPWSYFLFDSRRKLLKPIDDLTDELKRRIDELPDSNQRAIAREKVRKALGDRTGKQLPT